MDANAPVLSDGVTLSGFVFAQTVGDARLLLRPAQGHYSRGDVCEQRTHNPLAVGLEKPQDHPDANNTAPLSKSIPSFAQ